MGEPLGKLMDLIWSPTNSRRGIFWYRKSETAPFTTRRQAPGGSKTLNLPSAPVTSGFGKRTPSGILRLGAQKSMRALPTGISADDSVTWPVTQAPRVRDRDTTCRAAALGQVTV